MQKKILDFQLIGIFLSIRSSLCLQPEKHEQLQQQFCDILGVDLIS